MGSAKIHNLLDRTATASGGATKNPKNSAKTALNYLFQL
jgi:hypothetical protein